ncbi:MAG: fatty acid desaturase family protein [Candidatus Hydrogenedentota bacterium]
MKHSDVMTPKEIRDFSVTNDLSALRVFAFNWLSIVSLFAVVAVWTNPITIFLAIVLMGGRQLGLSVLVHECGHGNLFTKWRVNRFTGQWLAAAFVFSNAKRYRIGHGKHHRKGGTHDDPDLANYASYAVSRTSFRRKILRDLTGRTGVKTLYYSAKALGPKNVAIWIVANGLLWGCLYATGHGVVYLLWPVSWLTTFMLYSRVRNASEHGAVPDLFDPDPRKHTRTTHARWWERMTVAPNCVNYHLEHHILSSVPCYRLKAFHRFLLAKGVLNEAEICHGYGEVIRRLIKSGDSDTPSAEVTA